MKKIALAAVLAASLARAHAGVITFEDMASSNLSPGYGGLNWTNFFGVYGDQPAFEGTGYRNGIVSGTTAAFNGAGLPASMSATTAQGFNLTDAYFAGAWRDNLNIVATATFENGAQASTSFLVSTTGPSHEFFNWTGLASVTFVGSGGTPLPGLPEAGFLQFVMDDVNTSTASVPEPANMALMLAGVGLLACRGRRRRAA